MLSQSEKPHLAIFLSKKIVHISRNISFFIIVEFYLLNTPTFFIEIFKTFCSNKIVLAYERRKPNEQKTAV